MWLSTVTGRVPTVALVSMEMLAVIVVALTNADELTVIPGPNEVTVAVFRKPVPVKVIVWLAAPCPRDEGLVLVTVGVAATVKHAVHEPDWVSVFATVMFRAPGVAFVAMSMFTVSCVEESRVVEFTVIPVPENEAVAPAAKLVPVTTMSSSAAP